MLPRTVLSRSSSSLAAVLGRSALATRSIVRPTSVFAVSRREFLPLLPYLSEETPLTSLVSLAPRAYSAAAKLKETADEEFYDATSVAQAAPVARAAQSKVSSLIPEDGFFTEVETESRAAPSNDGPAAASQAPPARSDSTT